MNLIYKTFFSLIALAFLFLLIIPKVEAAVTPVVGGETVTKVMESCAGYTEGEDCFTSLSAWEAAYGGIDFASASCTDGDLTCVNTSAVAEIDGTWTSPDTTAVTINGWTTSATNYIKIYTTATARHDGTAGSGYILRADHSLYIIESNVWIDGLEIDNDGGANWTIDCRWASQAGTIKISNNIIHNGTSIGMYLDENSNNLIFNVWNNIIYDFDTGIHWQGDAGGSVYNNTIINNTTYGIYGVLETFNLKNNISSGNGTDYYHVGNTTYSNNISSDATSPDGASFQNQTVSFVSTTSGSEDFHLSSSDTSAKDAGTDLSADANLAFTTDIDGDIRSGSWDIGADEQSGGTTATNNITISSLTTSNASATGFDTSINYTGDDNTNAVTTLYYCNNTDTPSCDPTTGTSQTMTRGTGTYTTTVTNLSSPNDAGDTLNIRVIATDADGVSGSPLNSTVQIGTAPDTTAPATTSDLTVTSCTSTSCTLTWTAPGDDTTTGTATSYDIKYSTSNISNDTDFANATSATGEPTPSIAGSTETLTITGLTTGTTYYFALKTSDEVPNTSSLSNIANYTTPAPDTTAPTVPTNLTATAISSSQINLSWTASTDAVGVTGYNIYRCEGSGCTPTTQVDTSTTNSYSDTGLIASTTYTYVINAYDAVSNTSSNSTSVNTTTESSGVPIITSVSGTIADKNTIIINGIRFGTKIPAAPLIWDNCEEETVNTFPRSTPNSYSLVGYSDYQPADTREGEDIPNTHELKYRSVGQRPVSEVVTGPHNRSTKYLMGGHWEDNVGNHSGRDVQITVPSKENYDNGGAFSGGFKPVWYANWYYRVNPDWPACGDSMNHKYAVIQSGIKAYGDSTYNNSYNYQNFGNNVTPCQDASSLRLRNQTDVGPYDDLTADGNNQYVDNPKYNWVKVENFYANDSDIGQLIIKFNNIRGWGAENVGTWFTDLNSQGIGSMTLGGYYRHHLDGAGFQHNNAFRFFDDIYVDSTFARVILANNSNYDQATIMEPQIPTAWSSKSITVVTNLGKHNDGDTGYLFVFDGNNNHNNVGYPITIGGTQTDTTPPTLSSPSPSGTLTAGTTSTTLSITTNESATCKYGTTSGVAYGSIANTFSTTGGTSHSTTVSGLTNGSTYNYYIRCSDSSGNVNTTDTNINFSIATAVTDTTAPTNPTITIKPYNYTGTTETASSTTVSLVLSATDNIAVTEMSFANGTNPQTGDFSTWETYSTSKTYTLPTGDGTKTVNVRYRDASGNISSIATDTITLDTDFPSISNINTNTTSTTVDEVTTAQATITWTTDQPATTQIEYGFTTSYGTESAEDTSLTTSHTVNLENLSADGTTYNYRIITKDSAGNQTLSTNQSFTTSGTAGADVTPPSSITNLSSSNVSQTSVDLSWTAPGDDANSGTAASYDVRYSTSELTTNNWGQANQVDGEPTPSVAGSSESVYIAVGLQPNTTYYFALKTSDETGNLSSISNVISFTTLAETVTPPATGGGGGSSGGGGGGGIITDTTAPAQPTKLKVTSADKQITLTWLNPTDADFVRTVIFRTPTKIDLNKETPDNLREDNRFTLVYEGDEEEFTDTDLDNDTVYYYYISTYDKKPNFSQFFIQEAQPESGKKFIEVEGEQVVVEEETNQSGAQNIIETLFTTNLYYGLENEEVKRLQELFAQDKELYPEGIVSGYYGSLTTKAVERFQCKYEIICEGTPYTTGYGTVGPKTRSKLNEVYSSSFSASETDSSVNATSSDQEIINALQEQISNLFKMVETLTKELNEMLEAGLF